MKDKLFNIQDDEIQENSLKGKYNYDWVENSFSDLGDNNEIISQEVKTRYLGKTIGKKQIFYLFLIILLMVFGIIARIFYLQVIQGSKYRILAEGNRIRLIPISSERGIIFDNHNKKLVQNIPNFSLAIIPQDLPVNNSLENQLKRKKIIKKTVELSGVPTQKIENVLKKFGSYSFSSLIVKENLDYEKALNIYLHGPELPGIQIIKGNKRQYIIDDGINSASSSLSLSHILGYLGKLDESEYKELGSKGYLLFDNIGKIGLEKVYETELRGKYGTSKIEVDAQGHDNKVLAVNPPIPGTNLHLTIDLEAQVKLEDIIKKTLLKYNKNRASAIAMDPRDGSILALVSWPSFNNNDFSAGIEQDKYDKYINDTNRPLFNRAISGTYPSGSTVKMIMTIAALQEGIITPQTTFLSTGGLAVGQWFFNDWQAGGHGVTNATKALAWSVNTFYYYIGGGYNDFTGLGVDRIVKYLKKFGLSKITNIDLTNESKGFLPSKQWKLDVKNESWYVGDTYNLSIGQGDLLVTPLQVAVWTAATANNGYLVQPHLVDSIQKPNSSEKEKLSFSKTNIDVDKQHVTTAKIGMGQCVTDGSCSLLQYMSFSSGGKTGTAQWNTNNKQNHAWFTSFAPYDNPQIVVTVLIEEGEGGATTAMPVAYEFLRWWGDKYLK